MEFVKPGDPLFPVATATIGPLPSLGVVLIHFDYLTSPMQPVTEANPGRNYVLTGVQARELVQKINLALAVLDSSPTPSAEGPTH